MSDAEQDLKKLRKEVEELHLEWQKLESILNRLVVMALSPESIVPAREQAVHIETRTEILDRASDADQKTLKRVERGEPLKLLEAKPAKRTLHDRILEVFYREGGGGPMTRHQVYYYSGCSPTSSGVNTAYADLFENGFLERVKVGACLTSDGAQYCMSENFIAEPFEVYATFEAFVSRQNTNLQKILRAQRKFSVDGRREWPRALLCEAAGVSATSSGTNTAIARLKHLDVAETGRGTVTFSEWYLKAIQPVVRAFDQKTGTTTRHDVVTGKPL